MQGQDNINRIRTKAFSLAEVLITIGIIGVVATIIMPMMSAQHRERQTTTFVRKFYSQLTQSFAKSNAEVGDPTVWSLYSPNSPDGANNLMDVALGNYYKIIKDCDSNGGCWADMDIRYLDNTSSGINLSTDSSYSTARIVDGLLVATRVLDPACSLVYGNEKNFTRVCGEVLIDVNGKKPPNQFGYDTFKFYLTKFGFFPAGERNDLTTTFENHCLDSKYGTGCTGWLIHRSNMDYLHCSDLSWQGKTSCANIFNYDHSQGI